MDLAAFDKELARHDWFFDYSDDHSVWRRGRDHLDLIHATAKLSPEHNELFAEYARAAFNNGLGGTTEYTGLSAARARLLNLTTT
jgi:hypothetical protein